MERTAWHELTTEETLDPALPICDPHHHLWHGGARNRERYLLDELLRDLGSVHNIVSTVFMDCHSMYRKDGPEEMKPIGETEFVNGVAAMSASGQYGPTRIAAGIVSYADLQLGADRCMFESYYPVDGVSASYHLIWNTFKRLAKSCSASERAALFHDTATRVYRLAGN